MGTGHSRAEHCSAKQEKKNKEDMSELVHSEG